MVAVPCQAQTPEPSPEDLQRALQRRYDLVLDFSADFIQTYEGGVLRTRLEERGVVLVKKPGRMRWDYREPEPKLYLSDGERLYFYLPEDRQLIIERMPEVSEASTLPLFLAGAGDIVDDFTATFDTVLDPPPNSYVLRLTPTRTERDFEYLTVVIDATTKAILRLIASDSQGGVSTFFISNLKENLGLSDNQFVFEIPPGTDVKDNTRSNPLP
jgi:outer membrane lipoprotein carrier protein